METLDIPTEGRADDKFDREDFAANIVRALIEADGTPRGVVLGLTGTWGSGKSSILNFVAEEIEARGNPLTLVVRFDPWIFSRREDLIERFFDQLLAALEERSQSTPEFKDAARDVIGKLWRYSRGTVSAGAAYAANSFLFGSGPMVKEAIKALSNDGEAPRTLHQRRDDLRAALSTSGLSVIVLVDELDRVEDADVRAVAQLVKSVADFDSISYLIAYDRGRVVEALGDGDAKRGAAYLEKIVQYEIALPPVTLEGMTRAVLGVLSHLCTGGLIDLPADWTADTAGRLHALIAEAFHSGVIASPRLMKRWLAHFAAVEPAMRGEVDWLDLLEWSALSVVDPDGAENISTGALQALYENPGDIHISGFWRAGGGASIRLSSTGEIDCQIARRVSRFSRTVFPADKAAGRDRDKECEVGLADPRRIWFPRVLALQAGFGSHPLAPTFAQARVALSSSETLGAAMDRCGRDAAFARVLSDALIWDEGLLAEDPERLWLPCLRKVRALANGSVHDRLLAQVLSETVFVRALAGLLARGAMTSASLRRLLKAEGPEGPSDILIGVLAQQWDASSVLANLPVDTDMALTNDRAGMSEYIGPHLATGNIYSECASPEWMHLVDWSDATVARQRKILEADAEFEKFLWSLFGRTSEETALGHQLSSRPLLRATRARDWLGQDWLSERTFAFTRDVLARDDGPSLARIIAQAAQAYSARSDEMFVEDL